MVQPMDSTWTAINQAGTGWVVVVVPLRIRKRWPLIFGKQARNKLPHFWKLDLFITFVERFLDQIRIGVFSQSCVWNYAERLMSTDRRDHVTLDSARGCNLFKSSYIYT